MGFDLLELILLFGIGLVVLGPEQVPVVVRALAKVMRELRSMSDDVMRQLTEPIQGMRGLQTKVRLAVPTYREKIDRNAVTPDGAERAASGQRSGGASQQGADKTPDASQRDADESVSG